MHYNSRFFKTSIKILLVLLNILLFFTVIPYFAPIFNFLKYIVSCLMFGVVLYYLFRPLVDYMKKLKIPFPLIVSTVFFILALILSVVIFYIIPTVLVPIQEVANSPLERKEEVKAATIGFIEKLNLYSYDEIRSMMSSYFLKVQQYIFQNAFDIFSALTHLGIIFVLTPFTLFYFLKDDGNFHQWFISCVPAAYREKVEGVLDHLDEILSDFFHGQITVASIVTLMAFSGLYLVGMQNVPFLVFITFFLSLIPFLGTFLSIIPATLEGLTHGYFMAFCGGAVMTVIHLTEANIITPQVMKRRFDIHPFTIILLIMMSFFFFGLLGPLWITPAYVLVREFLIEAYEFMGWEEEK